MILALADQSTLPTLPPWALTLAVVLGVGSLTLAVLGTIGYFVVLLREDRIARAMRECGIQNAAPAPATPKVQGRAPAPAELCAVITCTNPWTVVIHGWKVCARHDHRAPYDRTVDPELVSEEAEQFLRGIAS